ncbi:MAG: methyltransferase domain-containing protein [Promethearchaeota archaeon]|nr:MAG: methyltransferase domain-containing protein [Candidatus Lokiarchaeota archaeon]
MDMREAMVPFGLALENYYYHGVDIPIVIVRDDEYRTEMSVKPFFRRQENFPAIERRALNKCKGKVVDLGAGVGADSLVLQNREFNITAVEINPIACEIMQQRGVKIVRCMDLFEFSESGFDTILLYGRSIGNVQDLEGLERFLIHAKTLLNRDGQIILDSIDLRLQKTPESIAYQQKKSETGGYFGEVVSHFEYKENIGPDFSLLHVDPDKLKEFCEKTGWICEIIYAEADGNYLAKLTQTKYWRKN